MEQENVKNPEEIESLDELMQAWKAKYHMEGHDNFVSDGVVCRECWDDKSKKPKICHFLKEKPLGKEKDKILLGLYDIAEDLNENFTKSEWRDNMWYRVSERTQAIQSTYSVIQGVYGEQNANCVSTKDCIEDELKEKIDNDIIQKVSKLCYNKEDLKKNTINKEIIKTIAVVNAKKLSDKLENENSDEKELIKYAENDKKWTKKELELLDLDVIVCGGTYYLLKIVLGDELIDENKNYAIWKHKVGDEIRTVLVLSMYHPAVRPVTLTAEDEYNDLLNICREAPRDWAVDNANK